MNVVEASPEPATTGVATGRGAGAGVTGATGVLPGLPGTEIGIALVVGVVDAVVGAGAGVLPV